MRARDSASCPSSPDDEPGPAGTAAASCSSLRRWRVRDRPGWGWEHDLARCPEGVKVREVRPIELFERALIELANPLARVAPFREAVFDPEVSGKRGQDRVVGPEAVRWFDRAVRGDEDGVQAADGESSRSREVATGKTTSACLHSGFQKASCTTIVSGNSQARTKRFRSW